MSTNRRRGHNFERHIAKLFRRWFPDAKRGYQYRGGDKDCDVVGTPFFIECKYAKRRLKYSPYSTWRKACGKREIPKSNEPFRFVLIIHRLAYKPIMVSMSFMAAYSLGILSEYDIRDSGLASCTWDIFSKAMDKKYGKPH